jgi:hypothetical protein
MNREINAAACAMSSSYFLASRRIQRRPRFVDGLAEVRVSDRGRHDQVDGPTEEIRERLEQAEVRVRVTARRRRPEFDEKVEVALARSKAIRRGGTE